MFQKARTQKICSKSQSRVALGVRHAVGLACIVQDVILWFRSSQKFLSQPQFYFDRAERQGGQTEEQCFTDGEWTIFNNCILSLFCTVSSLVLYCFSGFWLLSARFKIGREVVSLLEEMWQVWELFCVVGTKPHAQMLLVSPCCC